MAESTNGVNRAAATGPLRRRGLFAVLLVLGLLSRFWGLGDRPVHYDEAIHCVGARNFVQRFDYRYNPAFHGPVMYFAAAAMFLLFGASDWTARAIPAGLGVACCLLAWRLGRYLGARAAWGIAILLLISPTMIHYSRMLRGEVFVAALNLAAVVAGLEFARTKRADWLYAAAAALALHLCTKETAYLTAVIWGSFGAGWWIGRGRLMAGLWTAGRRSPWRAGMVALAAGAALCAAGLWIDKPPKVVSDAIQLGGLLAVTVLGGGIAGRESNRAGPLVKGAAFARTWRVVLLTAVLLGAAICVLLYTTFGRWPDRVLFFVDAIRYWQHQHAISRIPGPWHYYLPLLVVYEPLVLLAGLAGMAWAIWRGGALHWFCAFWAADSLVLYSWAQEKVPWLLMHITVPMAVCGGWWLGSFVFARPPNLTGAIVRWPLRIAAVVLGLYTAYSGWLVGWPNAACPAGPAADGAPMELLLYSQPSRDLPNLVALLRELAPVRRPGSDTPQQRVGLGGVLGWSIMWYWPGRGQWAFVQTPDPDAGYVAVLADRDRYEESRAGMAGRYVAFRIRAMPYLRPTGTEWGKWLLAETGPHDRRINWTAVWEYLAYRRAPVGIGGHEMVLWVRRDLADRASRYGWERMGTDDNPNG